MPYVYSYSKKSKLKVYLGMAFVVRSSLIILKLSVSLSERHEIRLSIPLFKCFAQSCTFNCHGFRSDNTTTSERVLFARSAAQRHCYRPAYLSLLLKYVTNDESYPGRAANGEQIYVKPI